MRRRTVASDCATRQAPTSTAASANPFAPTPSPLRLHHPLRQIRRQRDVHRLIGSDRHVIDPIRGNLLARSQKITELPR